MSFWDNLFANFGKDTEWSRRLAGAAKGISTAGAQGRRGLGDLLSAGVSGMAEGKDAWLRAQEADAQRKIAQAKAQYDPLGLLPAQAKLLGQQGASGGLTPVGPGGGQGAPARPGTTPGGPQVPGGGMDPAVRAQKLADARSAIARGAPREAVIRALVAQGVDPTGL